LLIAVGPFFERFFILGGHRGFRQKNLHKIDSIQLQVGPGGLIPACKGVQQIASFKARLHSFSSIFVPLIYRFGLVLIIVEVFPG
jgi:hypothetical protein